MTTRAPGQRVEIELGDRWIPAVIIRGPIQPPGEDEDEVWEVEAQPPYCEAYITARSERQMR